MVTFNSVALSDVAPVKVTDGMDGGAPVMLTMRERVLADGAFFSRVKRAAMKETVTFTLPVSDPVLREEYMRAIRNWCISSEPKALYMPKYEGLYTLAVCTRLPDRSIRQWWQEMTIEFTVPEPYYIDSAVKTAALGATPIEIGGTAPPLAYIAYTVPAGTSNLSWVLDGVTFSLAGSVATGALVIDFNRQTALVGTESVLDQMPLAQSIPILMQGVHTLTGNGALCWQERWM